MKFQTTLATKMDFLETIPHPSESTNMTYKWKYSLPLG